VQILKLGIGRDEAPELISGQLYEVQLAMLCRRLDTWKNGEKDTVLFVKCYPLLWQNTTEV
jgi:hypothetical protein